jgi:hypothetical protein
MSSYLRVCGPWWAGSQRSLFKDLAIRLEGAHEVQQHPLVGYTELVDAAVVEEVATFGDEAELPEQQLNERWSGTWQQLDVLVVGIEGLAVDDVAHVLLRDHRGLVRGHVVAVRQYGVEQVTLVGNIRREVIHGDLDRSWVIIHEN